MNKSGSLMTIPTPEKVNGTTISHKHAGQYLYTYSRSKSELLYLGVIIHVEPIEVSDGRDNWSQKSATVYVGASSYRFAADIELFVVPVPVAGAPDLAKMQDDLDSLREQLICAALSLVNARLHVTMHRADSSAESNLDRAKDGLDSTALDYTKALAEFRSAAK
jgi:hypothetical protein